MNREEIKSTYPYHEITHETDDFFVLKHKRTRRSEYVPKEVTRNDITEGDNFLSTFTTRE